MSHGRMEIAFVADRLDAEHEIWRTTPTDLGGWANRAAQMMQLARSLDAQNEELRRQIASLDRDLQMERRLREQS